MIDERQPKLERVDFRAGCSALQKFLERSCQRPGILVVTVNVNSIAQRQFDTCRRLKRREACSLKTFVKALLAIRASDIGHPFVISEET